MITGIALATSIQGLQGLPGNGIMWNKWGNNRKSAMLAGSFCSKFGTFLNPPFDPGLANIQILP